LTGTVGEGHRPRPLLDGGLRPHPPDEGAGLSTTSSNSVGGRPAA